MKSKSAQFTISSLGAIAIVLVAATITIAVMGMIAKDIGEEMPTESKEIMVTLTSVNDSHNSLNTAFQDPNIIVSMRLFNGSARASGDEEFIADNYNWTLFATNKSVYINITHNCTEGDASGGDYADGDSLYAFVVGTYYETAAYNATVGGEEGTEVMGSWLDIIALVIIAAIVIGIIIGVLGRQTAAR